MKNKPKLYKILSDIFSRDSSILFKNHKFNEKSKVK